MPPLCRPHGSLLANSERMRPPKATLSLPWKVGLWDRLLGEFKSQALLCTDPQVAAPQIIQWFVLRWQLEVTFQEGRAHLGIETQRQWSDLAIARTTPILFGLFSWVTLAAHVLGTGKTIPLRATAWYSKPLPTFSDAIALVRQCLWQHSGSFSMSLPPPDMVKIPHALLSRLVDTACYAA